MGIDRMTIQIVIITDLWGLSLLPGISNGDLGRFAPHLTNELAARFPDASVKVDIDLGYPQIIIRSHNVHNINPLIVENIADEWLKEKEKLK